jgi:hypothetical protein
MNNEIPRFPLDQVENLLSSERLHDLGYELSAIRLRTTTRQSLLTSGHNPRGISQLILNTAKMATQAEEIDALTTSEEE